MVKTNINTTSLRILSQIFTPSTFNEIVRENNSLIFEKKIRKHFNNLSFNNNLQIIRHLYKALQNQYRCEYIFKNNLFIDIIKSYGLSETLTLNEFKIGNSKADLILLNGSIRLYEIKTELDGLSKLSKQINDYQKFADKVYVVSDENYIKRLSIEYKDSNIGLIILKDDNKLEIVKEADDNSDFFDFETIFKTLRKKEYLELVFENFGYIPDVPNTKIFKECYQLLCSIEVSKFQKQVLSKLKERKLLQPKLLNSSKTPNELKYLCNSLDFNDQEYQNLYNFLSNKKICTNHI